MFNAAALAADSRLSFACFTEAPEVASIGPIGIKASATGVPCAIANPAGANPPRSKLAKACFLSASSSPPYIS